MATLLGDGTLVGIDEPVGESVEQLRSGRRDEAPAGAPVAATLKVES